jgi:MinD-like ATPase involved in chromosome partitioning or flagellar assembly
MGGRRVLVGGFGGGSGRTTVAAGLGIALAARRGGRVVAIDACPDQGGPLADRAGVPGRGVGLRELALADPAVASLAEARRFLGTVGPAGLEVLAGLRDLTGPGLTPAEAAWAVDLLERLFPAVVVDGPPGWTQPVPAVLLARADTVVLTAKAGFTESGCAQDALTALAAARADLPAGAVVVYVETAQPPGRALRRVASPEQPELAESVHAELTIPFDPALAGGGPVRWEQLRPRTQAAFEALAAAVDEAPLTPGGALGSAPPREVGWEGSRDAPWDGRDPAATAHRAAAAHRRADGPGEEATVPRARAVRPARGATAFGPRG